MTTSSQASDDRFCDLVMKGGITSGVVYPPAICELADRYRFKNIGGTSAGAIAAVATAAAEYRRRMEGTTEGFEKIKALPDVLAQKASNGKTQLLRFFQPDPPCRRLFTILITSLNAGSTFRRFAFVLLGCLKGYWRAVLASLVVSALVYWWSASILATILFLLIGVPVFVGADIYRDFTRTVVGNNYGLCKGLTTTPVDGPALTEWLHSFIQTTANRPQNKPLTFGDLWNAKGFPPPSITLTEEEKRIVRSINLEMFTTNLSHGRPYVFPHVERTARLFFKERELEDYLPVDVMAWVMSKSTPYAPSVDSPNSDPAVTDPRVRDLREIPPAEDFPVLLAARMSLSFPLLFSAVPLWAIDYEAPRGKRTVQRCLFSDGGISSNFPVHLFDGLLPSWPTFGVQLEPALKDIKNMIFLPHEYGQGIADGWTRFDDEENSAASKFGGFLMSIINAMQNWNDNTLARTPGVRDRVVRLRLKKNEGGLNLNMEPELIQDIAERGKQAADALMRRFYPPGSGGPALGALDDRIDLLAHRTGPAKAWHGWDFQRWVRLDVLIRTLADKAAGLARALSAAVPHSRPYHDLVQESTLRAPPGHPNPLTARQAQALQDLLKALEVVAGEFDIHSPNYPDEPIPSVELRVRPAL